MTKKFHLIVQICFLVLFIASGFVFHSLFFVQAADAPKSCWSKGLIIINECDDIIENKCVFVHTYDCVLAGPILHRCIWNPFGNVKRTDTCDGICSGPGWVVNPICNQKYSKSGCH
jgi:hypothetical protein